MPIKKLGERLKALISGGKWDPDFFENLEDALIEGDIGASAAKAVVDELKDLVKREKIRDHKDVVGTLKTLLTEYIISAEIPVDQDGLTVILVLGVNGVGKTTTIAKLAHRYAEVVGRENIILAAGDTFRAAAVDQLKIHGDRLGIRVVSQQQGSDAGSVLFDSIESALSKNACLVIADTAGRMHNKANLVNELQKMDRIIKKKVSSEACHSLLVIDATTGQNGLRQAEIFHEAIGVDSVALTKYDSAAKGGIVVSICRTLNIPFSYMGVGERYEDLKPFDKDLFLDTLLGNA